jgi:dipeptidyl aminopeptidase/acylaminoacyl peptidase
MGYRDAAGNTPSHFTHHPKGYENFNAKPYYMPYYQTVNFPSQSPNIDISAWFIPGKKSYPAIIIVHGYSTSKADTRILMMASLLHKHGFNVLAIDLRDNGESSKEDGRTSLGITEFNDILGAKKWLEKQGFSAKKIGIAAGSMGAASTLIAFQKDPTLTAIFIDSAYADLEKIIKEELSTRHIPPIFAWGVIRIAPFISGDNLLAESPINAMKHINNRSVMIVHSKTDPTVSFWHAQKLVEEAQKNKQTHVQTWFHNINGHCNTILTNTPEYESKLVTFFQEKLGKI